MVNAARRDFPKFADDMASELQMTCTYDWYLWLINLRDMNKLRQDLLWELRQDLLFPEHHWIVQRDICRRRERRKHMNKKNKKPLGYPWLSIAIWTTSLVCEHLRAKKDSPKWKDQHKKWAKENHASGFNVVCQCSETQPKIVMWIPQVLLR